MVINLDYSRKIIKFFKLQRIKKNNLDIIHWNEEFSQKLCCLFGYLLNPFIPMSDQHRISPYNIKQTSDEKREEYHKYQWVICWSNTKFSELTS